jgi:hypothetical protein
MSLSSVAQVPWASPRHAIDTWTDSWAAWFIATSSVVAWGTANRAIYVPVRVPRRCVVRELGAINGTTGAGNSDIGIYDASGVRLASTGSTAKTAATEVQAIDVTDLTIGPGLYYMALNNSTTTDTFGAVSWAAPYPAAAGVLTEALGSVTLPATATWAVDNTLTFIPGITALFVTEVS